MYFSYFHILIRNSKRPVASSKRAHGFYCDTWRAAKAELRRNYSMSEMENNVILDKNKIVPAYKQFISINDRGRCSSMRTLTREGRRKKRNCKLWVRAEAFFQIQYFGSQRVWDNKQILIFFYPGNLELKWNAELKWHLVLLLQHSFSIEGSNLTLLSGRQV